MGVTKSAILFMILGIFFVFSTPDASAQMFNQPYYLQVSWWFGRRRQFRGNEYCLSATDPGAGVAGPGRSEPVGEGLLGGLLEVQRGNSGQAFIVSQGSSYIPGSSSRGFATSGSGLGFAYGLGGGGGDGSYYGLTDTMRATPVYDVMASWISSIDGRGGLQGAYHPSGAGTMDAWIGQLYLM